MPFIVSLKQETKNAFTSGFYREAKNLSLSFLPSSFHPVMQTGNTLDQRMYDELSLDV